MSSSSFLGRSRWSRGPGRTLLGFLILIALGTFALGLPQAVASGQTSLSLSEALFTATSGATVTGLGVVPLARLSGFGQGVLLAIIQLGGLGVMTLAVLVWAGLKRRMALESGEVVETTLGRRFVNDSPAHTLGFVLCLTVAAETLGFLALWPALEGIPDRGFHALFMSISGFCNAGFDPLGLQQTEFHRWTIAVPLLLLWLLGGLGFLVPLSLWQARHRNRRLDPAVRMVLQASLVLVLLGPLLFWVLERNGLLAGTSTGQALLLSLFQGNTPRTAGFSMLDLSACRVSTFLFLIPLMLIGGGPGGTAGGVKITTVWISLAALRARIRGHEHVLAGGRRIPDSTVRRAVQVFALMAFLFSCLLFFLVLEREALGLPAELAKSSFLAASALGTVGLDPGTCQELGLWGRLGIVAAMIFGRLGPLTVALALFRSGGAQTGPLPTEAEIPVG